MSHEDPDLPQDRMVPDVRSGRTLEILRAPWEVVESLTIRAINTLGEGAISHRYRMASFMQLCRIAMLRGEEMKQKNPELFQKVNETIRGNSSQH